MLTHLISCLAVAVVLHATGDQSWVYVHIWRRRPSRESFKFDQMWITDFWLRALVFAIKSTTNIHLNSCSSTAKQVNTSICFQTSITVVSYPLLYIKADNHISLWPSSNVELFMYSNVPSLIHSIKYLKRWTFD